MRVAIDGEPLAATLTGVGYYTLELAKALAAIAPASDFTLVSPSPITSSVADDLKRSALSNLHEIHANAHRFNRYWWGVGLPWYLAGSSFDLFHGTNYDIPRWQKIPNVVTIHDLSLLLHQNTHEAPLVRRGLRRLPRVARSAAAIITATEAVKQEICRHFNVDSGMVTVTPYAPRAVFKRLPRAETFETCRRLGVADQFILFVGTIEPRKNLETLVRAFDEILRATEHRPQLVIAGKQGWLMEDFLSPSNITSLKEKVLFTGYVSDEDLSALYSACNVFIYPSIYEGFGLPPLEAMACGAPVVTSNIPVIRETVGNAAELVNASNVTELARAIVKLLDDPQASARLSVLGQQHARTFTWSQTAKKTLEVYERIIKRRW